jgi:hypothetical protein
MSSDKIVYTVPGYKILKELQNEILEENEIESKFQNSEFHRNNPKMKLNTLNSQKTGAHPQTIIFSELASPTHNLYNSMKDNLNVTSLLLKNRKPNTATGLTSDRLKVLTMNSNFSTTNNFFTNKQSTNQSQNLDATTLSRIVIRNSKRVKIPINVNETRLAMVPAGHSRLPSVIKDENKTSTQNLTNGKNDLLRLKYDEAKLEKIIASNEQKKKEIQEIDYVVKKKLEERSDHIKEYFNKKDPFWRSFFDSNKVIEQFDVCSKNFNRRMDERIQDYHDDKYKRQWCNIHVGKNKPQKNALIFGREDLRKFEEIFVRIKKNVRNADEPATVLLKEKEKEDFKRSKTNLSKISSDKD